MASDQTVKFWKFVNCSEERGSLREEFSKRTLCSSNKKFNWFVNVVKNTRLLSLYYQPKRGSLENVKKNGYSQYF